MDFDSISKLEMYQIKGAITMLGDFTYQYDEIYKSLAYYNRVRIPLYIMFYLILH